MQRNKDLTKQKLIDAVGEIVLEQGFKGIGVNAIAKQAGVDKVLIYRYFENLNGLLKAYVLQEDYFSKLDDLVTLDHDITSKAEFVEIAKKMFLGQLRYLRQNKKLQEFLLWELEEINDVTVEVGRRREEQGVNILNRLKQKVDFNKFDIPAISNIIISGIYYLVLRSRTMEYFSGISIQSEEGWLRMENAISMLVELVAETAFKEN